MPNTQIFEALKSALVSGQDPETFMTAIHALEKAGWRLAPPIQMSAPAKGNILSYAATLTKR